MTRSRARRKAKPTRAGKSFPPIDIVAIHDERFMDEETGGGLRAHFGQHHRICELSSRSLEWYIVNYDTHSAIGQRFKDALDEYYYGLEAYMHKLDNYKHFIVPFGKTYRGLKIYQVRDKEWFRWIKWTPALKKYREEYRLFFTAIHLWLKNPRHYEHSRDIGELLSRTEYQDDLDLNWNEDCHTEASDMSNDDDDEANSSDDNFIVSDSDDCGSDDYSCTKSISSSSETNDDTSQRPSPSSTSIRTRSSIRHSHSAVKLHRDRDHSDTPSLPRPSRSNTTPSRKSKRKHHHQSEYSDLSTQESPTKRRHRNGCSPARTVIDCVNLGKNFRLHNLSPSKGQVFRYSGEDFSGMESSDDTRSNKSTFTAAGSKDEHEFVYPKRARKQNLSRKAKRKSYVESDSTDTPMESGPTRQNLPSSSPDESRIDAFDSAGWNGKPVRHVYFTAEDDELSENQGGSSSRANARHLIHYGFPDTLRVKNSPRIRRYSTTMVIESDSESDRGLREHDTHRNLRKSRWSRPILSEEELCDLSGLRSPEKHQSPARADPIMISDSEESDRKTGSLGYKIPNFSPKSRKPEPAAPIIISDSESENDMDIIIPQ
ncbi:hypothetical protein DFH05DRAFT_1518254 [Lentinula detonsa]|uniref:Uncharacterized protein n=1 Tax=Lentinula detonsa TaxID=2804962 RepID=A0A9W8PAA9_9AGAR|nr:hypothetical protein DFH05DRAFT_1518254 [Lentinula detonsa]